MIGERFTLASDQMIKSLVDTLEEQAAYVERMSGDASARWDPLPHQIAPPGEWDVWGIMAGRGAGKTHAGSHYVLDHLRKYGPEALVGIGGPTLLDVRLTLIEGPSGILSVAEPGEFDEDRDYNRTLLTLRHRDGGTIRGIGSERPERWRGPNFSLLWADELASWVSESWDLARFALRLGPAQALFTTTPKNRPFLRELIEEEGTVLSTATTYDNPHLSSRAVRALESRYGGTRLGKQELLAELLSDAEGALWKRWMIDNNRVQQLPEGVSLLRVVVAVDPAVSANKNSAETGIIIVGRGSDGHAYIMSDVSGLLPAAEWGRRVATNYKGWMADRVVGEVNNGGDLVEMNVKNHGSMINFHQVRASRGKAKRAEPAASLYERGLVHHVGEFPELEDQLCQWEPLEPDEIPCDRLDACVWGLTDLMIDHMGVPNLGNIVDINTKKSRFAGR